MKFENRTSLCFFVPFNVVLDLTKQRLDQAELWVRQGLEKSGLVIPPGAPANEAPAMGGA